MTSHRTGLAVLAAVTAMTALAAPASAQQVDRIVAFGDSYADTGNFFKFVGINPAATSVYTSGRFSGGTNYIDTLSTILGVPVDNFAIGGALTNNYNTNVGPALGLPTEVGSFLSGGAGATPFPAVSGTFKQGDLLAISIGGNDARLYERGSVANGTPGPVIPPGTLAAAPAAGAASAAAATASLNALVAAGAPTISYLAGSTANIPEIALQPNPATAFAIRDAYYQSYDAAMRSTLAGYAARGEIVHYLDLNALGTEIKSNFSAYGLTSLACPPFPNPTCVTNSSQYLFYGDQLHLTSAGFAIVAKYIAVQLTAPLTLGATSDIALDTAHQWGRTLTSRMDLAAPRDGDQPEGVHAYVVGDSLTRTNPLRERSDSYRSNTKGVTAGVDVGFGSGLAGVAVNYSKPHANFINGAAETNTRTWQVGGYAAFGLAGGFVQGYLGYGHDRHRIERAAVIDSLSARANGNHIVGGAKAGYLFPFSIARVGPVAALDYARVKVDGYTESGDAALSLNVNGVRYHSMRGSAGLELRGDFAPGGLSFRPYADFLAEKNFSGDGRVFVFSETIAPTIVNRFAADSGSKKVYGRAIAGASASLFGNVALDVSLSATSGKPNGNETTGHLGVKLGF